MRKTPWLRAEKYRVNLPGTIHESRYGDTYGVFLITRADGQHIRCLVSDGDHVSADLPKEFAWEHVSVSLEKRCPTWEEMCLVKELFWHDEECVVQFHPPKSEYKNCHPYTLHMWRSLLTDFPRPPSLAV